MTTPIADMVKQMLAAGVEHDTIVLAIETAEKAAALVPLSTRHPVDTVAENRRAYDREYKRKKRSVHPTSSGIPPDEKPASSLEDKTPDQNIGKPQRERDIGRRIPPDWEPSPEDIQFAMERGFSPPDIENTRIKFKNFWDAKAGKDSRKLDWSKTWRVWIANERRPRQAELRLVTTYEGGKHGTSRNAGGFAHNTVRFGSQRAASQGGHSDDP